MSRALQEESAPQMLELRTLGTVGVYPNGRRPSGPIPVQPKRLALLAYLALAGPGQFRRRDTIVGLFWPESDEEHARGALRQAIRDLRRALGSDVLVSLGEEAIGVADERLRCDASAFCAASSAGDVRTALELYRGDFLDGLFVSSAGAELDQWIDGVRTELRRRAVHSARIAAEEAAQAGDLSAAADLAWRALSLAPEDESSLRRLIMVLDRKGERAAAIRVFDEFTARLGAELGADPSPETVALVDSLRSPDLHLAPSVPPAQPTTRPVEPPDDPQLEVLEPIAVPVPIPEEIPRHRVGRGKWSLSAVGGAIAVSLAIALSPALRHDPRSAFDPDLIAVARFDVPEPSLQLWGEGLVDLLSRSLDRAGPLRTVSQTVALRHWEGRADPASAAVLGSRTGAGLVVFGTVTRRGADSVSLRASVLDRSRNRVEGELEVVGAERRMAELGDSLGLLILRALGQSRPVGSLRLVSIGGRSLPALKEFLRGEQFYRRGLWDSALVHYQAAVAQDTAFPLALRRLAVVLSWNPATAGAYQPAEEYARRSMVLNHGLSPRESLLIVADSLNLAAQEATTALDLVSLRFRSMAALEEAARRYPGHAEVWYALGEARFHSARPLGGTPSYALEAFNRAIALDSGFAPAYEHGVQLAVQLGRPAAARRYAEAYGRLDPTSANAESIRLAGLLLGPRRAQAEASRLIDSASLHTLFRAGLEHLGYWPDSAETAVQILLMMGQGSRSAGGDAPWVLDSLMWKQYAGRLLAFRGHLHQAYEIDRQLLLDPDASPYSGFQDPFLSLSLLGIIPDSLASAIFGRSLRPDSPWEPFTPRHLRGLPWWLARGDTTSLARFAARASEVVRQSRTPMTILRARLLGATAMAYLTLARGDSAEALQALAAIPDTLCLAGSFAASCFHVNLPLARLLGARGDHRKAIDLLDRWRWDAGIDPLFVIATLELGRAAEQLGDRERALASYRFVTDVWQRADPELRSCVLEARAGLARLTGSATSGGTHACGAVR